MRKCVIKDSRINGEIEELIRPPIIVTVNHFTEEAARRFHAGMSRAHTTGQTVIPVVIDSYGGDVYALISMISAIDTSRLPVATIVEGKAQSCGSVLFSCGTQGYRFMAPSSNLMIHDMTHELIGRVGETKADQDHSANLDEMLYQRMAKNCGQSPQYFLDLMHSMGHVNWYLSAKQARKHGLCNHIRIPELKTTISVQFSLD